MTKNERNILIGRYIKGLTFFFFYFFGHAGEMLLRIPRPDPQVLPGGGMWDSPYLTGPTH